MAKNILFTLVDQYGNSLENIKFNGSFNFLYNYPNKKPESVLSNQLQSGVAYGDLPKPDKSLESTTLIIQFESQFYNAPETLVFKEQYKAPQNIVVVKKTLDPQEKEQIVDNYTEELRQAVQARVSNRT
jgi:hypothetical protein